MSRRLLISSLPGETRAAWLDDGELVDLVVLRADRPSRLGNIYHGRVTKVDKALDGAFVEVGLPRPGFLPLSEAPGRRPSEGDAVVVRILREAFEGKGARLSANILGPPPDLEQAARQHGPPALLFHGDDPIERTLASRRSPDEIIVDDPDAYVRVKVRLHALQIAEPTCLRLDLDPAPLFEREGLDAEIEALLRPRVDLPSGAFLLVEPVVTLTAIDVNSGRHQGRGAEADRVLPVNLEAAKEIVRQVRLRALSGLIVIDFLAVEAAEDRKRILAALRSGLKRDPEPTRVSAMGQSGLVEMTRRRGRPPLHELLTIPCGIEGSGRDRDPVSLAFEALRSVRREAAAQPGRALAIRTDRAVIAAFDGPAAAARQAVEARLGRPLTLLAAAPGTSEAVEVIPAP